MRVLIFSHPCVNAINQQFYAEVENLTSWDIVIVTPDSWKSDYEKTFVPERWPDYHGKLIGVPVWKSGNVPLHIYRTMFINLINEIQPDVIYIHHEAHAVATFQICVANLLSLRRPIGFYSAQNILKNYPLPFRLTEEFVFRQSCFAFPVSHSVNDILLTKGFSGDASVLPLGIDSTVYHPHPESDQLANSLRHQPNEVLIGYVGRIVEEKGLKTLLLALEQIQSFPWRLILVGVGPYESEFNAIVQQLGLENRITLLGYIPHQETPRYLSAFDLLVIPSESRPHWKEQFGRVIIEALACGTPVVGSDSGEIPNLINDTQGGFIFPEGQAKALAKQLSNIVLDAGRRSKLAAMGQQKVLERYTSKSVAEQFAHTIESAVSKRDIS